MRLKYRFLALGFLLAGLLVTQSAFADNEYFRGCLTGTKDNYVLRSTDGNLYRLHSSDDIKGHVGQMVEVKGHVENKDRDKAAASQNSAARAAGVTIPTVGIDVVHIKSLAGSCADMKADAGVAVAPGASTSTTVTTTTTTTTPNAGVAVGTSGVSAGVASGVDSGVSGAVAQGVATESGKYEHFTGCLTGVKDNYILRADDGSLYRLHSDKDINEHVNARVDVRGRIDNKDRDRQAQVNAPVAAQAGVEVPRAGINVEDIKTISGACTTVPR